MKEGQVPNFSPSRFHTLPGDLSRPQLSSGAARMAKSKKTGNSSSDMGLVSPQSRQSTKAGVSDPGKSKKAKSKSKRSGRDKVVDPVADRAALEEESARALMLLSTSALQNGSSAPYYNLDDDGAHSRGIERPLSQTQVEERTSTSGMNKSLHKTKKVGDKSKKGMELRDQRKRQTENQQESPPPEAEPPTHPPRHPLDDESSGDDVVQEYERGVSREQARPLRDVSLETAENTRRNSGTITSKGNSQNGVSVKRKPSKKRKRQTEESAVDRPQSQGLAIDPSLHALDALPHSLYPDPLDTLNANALPELHRSKSNKSRIDQPLVTHGDNEDETLSGADEVRNGDQGLVFQSFEDQDPMYSALDTRGAQDHGSEMHRSNLELEQTGDKRSEKAGRGGKGGFSADEIAKLDNYRDQYCRANDLIVPGFNHLIQLNVKSNEVVNKIFNEIQELFPERTRSAVQRFCRRRYHNFHARGVWTPEEDADLKAAVAEKGTSWKAVGELLGRFNEDCRDRYRNYLAPSAAHRNRDAWTEKEVINLSNSILECMHLMKRERQRSKEEEAGHEIPLSDSDSDQEAEDLKLVNWQTVSDMMGRRGTARSRIQCSFKWGKIKKADRDRYLKEVKEAQNNLRGLEKGKYTANNMRRSTGWRLKAAAKHVKNMKAGDKYDLLNAILDSAAPEEDNIPWRMIGDEEFRQKWSFSERKAGWFAMKKQVEGSEEMDYRQVIQRLLRDLLAEGVNERWIPTPGDPAKKGRKIQQKDRGEEVPREDHHSDRIQQAVEAAKHDELMYENNEAAQHVRAAPVPNMRRDGYHSGSESPDSLFDGEQPDIDGVDERDFEHQHSALGEVGPELAGRIHLLQSA